MSIPTFSSRLRRFCGPWVTAMLAMASVSGAPVAPDPASLLIDKLVDEGLVKAQQKPNAPAGDDVFLRRIYLDVIGRIPTAAEATEFLNDKAPDRRARLIDTLLASEGYVSHWFNYWADILRLKSNIQLGNQMGGAGDAYGAWVKAQLRSNTPYNKFVYQMLTAQGYVWDTGAVGYYMRDAGMPLDNMANTCQIFLGTRVACAQCHNHPFDAYKQKDFYEMAAYTCGVDTRVSPQQIISEATGKKVTKQSAKKIEAPGVLEELADLLEPLSYGTRQDPKKVQKLPDDFRGDPKNPSPKEGKPGEEVKAQPVFSREKIKANKEILENYAGWMTSPENPSFTVVIANRLWKSAMGIGLIEPVDDIKKAELDKNQNDATKLAGNPALMAYLTQHMKSCGYDMKKFLRSIYNSKAYQREATTHEILAIEDYKFPGPVVRRMSAEQMWDTLVTLVIPSPDERKSNGGYHQQLSKMKAQAEELQDQLRAGNGKGLLDYARARATVKMEFDEREKPWRQKLTDARTKGDKAAAELAQAEIDKLESARFDGNKKVYDQHIAKSKPANSGPFANAKPVMMDDKDKMKKAEPIVSESDQRKWSGYDAAWMRASELPSPAPNGHFLQEFGQSERDIIQSSNADSSVTQALLMLNSRLFDDLTAKNTQLGQVLMGIKTPDEKRDQLFVTILSRLPDDREKGIVAKQVEADGADKALRRIAWALLNTREFTFVK